MFDELIGRDVAESEPEVRARKLTETAGYAAAALTIIPLPGTELLGVTALHVAMVVGIGQIHGADISKDSALELVMRIATTVGVSLVGSRLATTAAKFLLPGFGGLISAPFMYASTIAIGAIAERYFLQEGELSSEELKDLYKRTVKEAKSSFDASKMRSDEAKGMAEAAAADATGQAVDAATKEPDPEPAESTEDPIARLRRLKTLLDEGLITQAEYDDSKARVLAEI
jgi:uncharacterized protein (DUF697 family)